MTADTHTGIHLRNHDTLPGGVHRDVDFAHIDVGDTGLYFYDAHSMRSLITALSVLYNEYLIAQTEKLTADGSVAFHRFENEQGVRLEELRRRLSNDPPTYMTTVGADGVARTEPWYLDGGEA